MKKPNQTNMKATTSGTDPPTGEKANSKRCRRGTRFHDFTGSRIHEGLRIQRGRFTPSLYLLSKKEMV